MANARCPQCKSVSRFQTNEEVKERRRDQYKEDEDGYLQVDLCLICGWGGIERSIDVGGYFNRELPAISHEWPRMGRLCSHCTLRIPRFLDLDTETAARARELAKQRHMIDAIKVIEEAAGCGLNWARLWAEHPDGPRAPSSKSGPPCAYCARPLVSDLAKQCLECGLDWHDPDNVHRLG